MADISKISPDDGSTILNVKDRNAVHWSESKGYVGKNLLNNLATTKTIQQVTFTVNDDKSIKVNGTNSGNENNLELGNMVLKAGKYIVSGTGFSSNTLSYQITDYPVTKQLFRIYNGDTEITLENDTHICVRLVISQGGTYSNHIVYPMIRLSSISDSTYEPYLTPNTEIDNKLSYADNAVLGAKNLTRRTIANGTTEKTVVVTVNSDDSVTLNGTATGGTAWIVFSNGETKLKKGTYKISGLPSDGSGSTFGLFIRPHGQSAGTDIFVNDTLFTVNEDTVYDLLTPVRGNYTADNLTIKPMIRLASDTDDTYYPYVMTNRELTDLTKIVDVTNSITTLTQSDYSVSDLKVIKQGNNIGVRCTIKSLTKDTYPSGQTWTNVLGALPKNALNPRDINQVVISTMEGKKPLQYTITTDVLSVRGGSLNTEYILSFTYICE